MPALAGKTILQLRKRLGEDWSDLALYFDIPRKRYKGFAPGRECDGVVAWLKEQEWLGELTEALAAVDRDDLIALLECRFKDRGLLALLARIVESHHTDPGKGLPIGALTSQHFANYYLAGLDRLLLEGCRVRGLVRYMDDLVWWGDDKSAVRDALAQARAYAQERLRLTLKTPVQVGRSRAGLLFCGYRLLPGRLLLSRRRKRRYAECRRAWENAYAAGRIDARALQAGYATALAITAHADAAVWRREQLRRHPLALGLCDL